MVRYYSHMETVTISRFKATCLELLDKVKRTGESLVVTRRGEPIAEIVPPSTREPRSHWLGCLRGSGEIVGDIVAPVLSEKEWEVLEVRQPI